ncbi:MAG: hypothetical protein CMA31_02655 [Euryarchaeota archaeon]|nr:hypothetical protein [Euryarchaeota archaeon]|tara:strand:- start:549 stop:3797 length:3249 start_codon:yes stop_codon:yes gene_type:complete
MANLVSPGVQVQVIDESFYTPAEPGTVPMIFFVSAQDKKNGAGTGTASGTTKKQAGTPFLLTSQRELTETFGDPTFYTDTNNNPINGSELNEYGLQAAYSYLGVSNRAFVTRADINTSELLATATEPAADPADGTHWFDTKNTLWGIFEWNSNAATVTGGQTFTNKIPTVITDTSKVTGGVPKTSVGAVGDYAVVATTTLNKLFYKNTAGTWVQVGGTTWVSAHATVIGTESNPTITGSATMSVNGTVVTSGGTALSDVVTALNAASIAGVTSAVVDGKFEIYSTGVDVVLATNGSTLLAEIGLTAGTVKAPALQISAHTDVPAFKSTDTAPRPTGSIWVKTTQPNVGARFRVKKFNGTTNLWEDVVAPMYTNNHTALFNLDKTGGGVNLAVGTLYVNYNNGEVDPIIGDFKIHRRTNTGNTSIKSSIITSQLTANTYAMNIQESIVGQAALGADKTISVTTTGASSDADEIAGAINSAGFTNIQASVDASNRIVIEHNDGGEFRIKDTGGVLNLAGFSAFVSATSGTPNLYDAPTGDSTHDFVASNWQVLTYTASETAPTALTTDGRLWYSSIVDEVDILVHNGTTWVGYLDSTSPYFAAADADKTDPAGPIVSATEPTLQSDGTALKNGDIWISTADTENYPKIYKFNGTTLKFVLVDNGDQTTEDGVVFADARYNTSGANSDKEGTIAALLVSNFIDTDAPDPALYPKGMMLYNLRRSGFNVKKFVRNYVNTATDNIRFGDESQDAYYAHRWVTESANQTNGAGSFGRKAQRKVIVQALQALVNSNQKIRDDESRIFNLMACPGYSELIGEMVTLNTDRSLSAFIIGDSPFRLTPDATTLNNWGKNVALAVEDNDDGLVTSDEYLGVFYPSLFTSDNAGNNVVVPPSHGILRTFALSDQVSFPWFAPAGTRRGGITNASAAGYIDAEGEFVSTALNEGQRDTLYSNNINPITFLTGAGLLNYGQKTRARNASALDRINVARLVIYLRSQLKKLAKPYIFEPNDKITRDEIKAQTDTLLLELVGQRALYDFLVVCDESNNTPSRIDRNELYLDIAIEPVKAVEFIYIPLRLKNTGEIAGL